MISAFSIGIIGGADGPIAIVVGHTDRPEAQRQTANSSLHFKPVEEIEWRIVFHETLNADVTVFLK